MLGVDGSSSGDEWEGPGSAIGASEMRVTAEARPKSGRVHRE